MSRKLAVQATKVNVVILGFNLVAGILLARALGPSGRGELAAATILPAFLVVIGSFGMGPAIIYFAASRETGAARLFGTGQWIALLQSFVLVPLGYLALPLFLRHYDQALLATARLYLVTVPLGLSALYSVSLLTGGLHVSSVNALNAVIPVGYVIGIAVMLSTHRLGVRQVVLLQLGLNVIVTVAGLLVVALHNDVSLNLDRQLARAMLRYGSKSQLGTVSQTLNLRLDQALIAGWLPARDLGLYVAAVNSVSLLQAVSQAGRMIFTPRVVRIADSDTKAATIAHMYRQYLVVLLAAGGLLAVVLPVAIPLVFGQAFVGAILPAYILLLAGVVYAGKEVLSAVLRGLNDPWQASSAEIIALAVTVPGLVLLVPSLGINGAAMGSLLAYIASLVVLERALRRGHQCPGRDLFMLGWADMRDAAGPGWARVRASLMGRTRL